jgi:hypothetical protein
MRWHVPILLMLAIWLGCAKAKEERHVAAYDLKDTRSVIASADRIEVTYADQWQQNLLGKTVESSAKCQALAKTLPVLQYEDQTGQSLTNQYALKLSVKRDGETIATYILHGALALSFERSGRWYVAEIGSFEFARELERLLLEGEAKTPR